MRLSARTKKDIICNINIEMPDKLKDKRILIFQQRDWGKVIGRPLAKRLYDRGCRLAAFTFKSTTHAAIVQQTDVHYDLIVNHDEIFNNPKKFLAGDDFSLEEICADLGVDSVWPLIYASRRYVYSYGEKYYYSFRQNVPDEMMSDYIKAIYKCCKIFFDEFNPDIIIAFNFIYTALQIFKLYAQKRGITMLAFCQSKVQGTDICVYNYKLNQGPFFDRLNLLNKGQVKSKNTERARRYVQEFQNGFKKITLLDYFPQETLWQEIRHELHPYRKILRWPKMRTVNRLENIGPTPDNPSPKIILRDHYASKAYKKAMEKFPYYPFEKLGKFVYFPLQWQPEILLEVISPHLSNQIETARQTAMSLPGDYTLAVKEHPGMIGKRSPSYIEKLARTPNVKVLDYRLSNEEILKKADLVISPGGTTIAEAAFLAKPKPVVQIGDMGVSLCLPNVVKHSDMTTLSEKIKQALKMDLNTKEYQTRLENFTAAAYDVGFYWERNRKGEKNTIEKFCSAFQREIERVFNKNN